MAAMDKHHFKAEARFIFHKRQERSFLFLPVPGETRFYPPRINIDFGRTPHNLVVICVQKTIAAFGSSQDK